MKSTLRGIFQKAKYRPGPEIAPAVWSAIVAQNGKRARRQLWIFTSLSFFSLVLLLPAFRALSADLKQSGFYEFFWLMFSNGSSIVFLWKEFLLSLAESLPTASIMYTLSLIFVSFLSLRHLFKLKLIN